MCDGNLQLKHTRVVHIFRSDIAAPAGAFVVYVTYAGDDDIGAQALEVSGLVSTSPVDVAFAYVGTGQLQTLTFTPDPSMSQSNELAVSLMAAAHDGNPGEFNVMLSAGWVNDAQDNTSVVFGFAHDVTSTATVPALTWCLIGGPPGGEYVRPLEMVVTFKGN